MSTLVSTQNPSTESVANNAAVSTPKEIDIAAIVSRQAEKKSKSPVVRGAFMLNREKLLNSVRAEWKSLMGMEAKGNRVPEEMDGKLCNEVDAYIMKALGMINPANAVSIRKSFAHDSSNMAIVEKVVATGKNILALEEQKLGVNVLVRDAERRLKYHEDRGITSDNDIIVNIKKYILKLQMTKSHILATIEQIKVESSK